MQTYEQALDRSLASVRIITTMFMAFGMAAVPLAAIGIYGVVSFIVTQRTPEIGIRMALGAGSGKILGLIRAAGRGSTGGRAPCGGSAGDRPGRHHSPFF